MGSSSKIRIRARSWYPLADSTASSAVLSFEYRPPKHSVAILAVSDLKINARKQEEYVHRAHRNIDKFLCRHQTFVARKSKVFLLLSNSIVIIVMMLSFRCVYHQGLRYSRTGKTVQSEARRFYAATTTTPSTTGSKSDEKESRKEILGVPELVKIVATRHNIPQTETKRILETFLNTIAEVSISRHQVIMSFVIVHSYQSIMMSSGAGQ